MRILLGISGGIAAYKTPELVRRLRERGHEVRCVLSAAAGRLVAAEALAAVSGAPVDTSLWAGDGRMPHIELPRWCECLLVAPATADRIAHFALGLGEDLLDTLYLALEPEIPVLLAPAMNGVMWQKPVVQEHLATLRERDGVIVVEPVAGELACGESGVGALAGPEAIAEAIAALDA